ncbi:coiled-coil domain-containing protein 138 [Rana temporaria]|uniref:coiled-coil domain-containing protein 138 n=1 Tax=Rana temporaria TaxID=8407 RepID=UPI001AACED7A|nr:coiled-coil domain-containing protein 138 [Rana temporaria]XP_040192407.1 coiled-coil domain-containing protein 138 [Rana temporaria]
MADSRMLASPTSHSAENVGDKKHYNKALKELLGIIQSSKWIDYEYDFSQTDIADQSDDDVCPIQDYNTHLYTETDVTLPSHLVANTCIEPSLDTNSPLANKLNLRRPRNSSLKVPSIVSSEVRDIYEELSEIYQKLQKERMSQHEYSLQLKKREQSLRDREDMLFKHQATLSKIKSVEEIVHDKFGIMKQQHDAEVKRLSEALKDKVKENKRLKSSFDTLKEMNDALKKQLNEVSEQNKTLEIQARKVQSRLENLQKKQAFLTVQRCKDVAQVIRDPKFYKIEKAPVPKKAKVLSNMQVYKLLTYLMDWMYASEESRSGDKPLCTDKLPVNCVQEKCAKALPIIMEQFEWMPYVNAKMHLSFMRFTYWTVVQLDSATQSTMTSTLRRIGDETYKGVLCNSTEDDSMERNPKSVAFFKSNNLPLRFISTLVVLKTVTQVDYLAQALDSLCMDLKCDEGRILFLEYQAVPMVVHLLHLTNRGLISSVLDILLQLSMETRFLQPFLESCSTESFFRTCAVLLKDSKVDVQILEKLSIVLQKLSKVRSNKKFFDTFNIPQVIQEMQRTANPDHAFLVINLNSILFHLGFSKPKILSPSVGTNQD